MKKTPLAASNAVIVSVLSMEEIKALPREVQCAKFAERDQAAQRAFSEMGKLRRAIEPRLKRNETIYGVLRKSGVKDGTISNAGYGAEAFALVESDHLTEAEFDRLTFSECLAISRATGAKSKRKVTPEEIVVLFRADEQGFRKELESIFETGVNLAEAAAQAEKAAEDAEVAEAARVKATQDAADAKAKAATDAAVAAALAAQQQQQSTPPVTTSAPVVQTPVAQSAPAAQSAAPDAPKSNVVQMPQAAEPDAALPDALAALDTLLVMARAFTTEGKEQFFEKLNDMMGLLSGDIDAERRSAIAA